LACNLALADALFAAHTGLFRVMPPPDARAVNRLRHTAAAFGLDWPKALGLSQYEKQLNPSDPRQSAFMLAVRRAGGGASYEPYRQGVTPWHAAMAANYAHGTAPLRRLADRYVVRAALAVANGQPVPLAVTEAFARLPAVMARADARENQIERAVIDLAETAFLADRAGEVFEAVVTDIGENGARIQLCHAPVVARTPSHSVKPGAKIRVRLLSADTEKRTLQFERLS
jgi:exoribonuclease R